MAQTLKSTDWVAVKDFYKRRARRIVPVYLLVQVLLLCLAPLFFLPFEVRDYVGRLPYFLLGAPNVGYWMDNTYFATHLFRPALHFWSLGVEMQFYLIFPIILILHKRSRVFSVLILLLSLGCCMVMTGISPKTAFFLTPFRVWQFMAGFFVAKYLTSGERVRSQSWLRPVAFYACVIVIIFLSYIKIPENRFPWFFAVPVVFAGVVFIAAEYRPENVFGRGLFAVLEKLGEWSYSIYMFHFPIIFIINYKPFGAGMVESMSPQAMALAVGLTLVFSILSYKYIEKPFRHISAGRAKFATGMFILAVILIVVGWRASVPLTWMRFQSSPRVVKAFEAMFDRGVYRCGKVKRITEPFHDSCTLTAGKHDGSRPVALLVGNSHADAIKHVLKRQAKAQGAVLLMMKSDCILGQRECTLNRLSKEISERNVDAVIVHSTKTDDDELNAGNVQELVALGREMGFKVFFIDPVPVWDEIIPAVVYRSIIEKDDSLIPRQDYDDYMKRCGRLIGALKKIDAPNFKRYSVGGIFCTPQCRIFTDQGYLLYHDKTHLTLRGAEYLEPIAVDIFKQLK